MDILSDRLVTREEYEDAFSDFQACMEERGFPLVDVNTNAEHITYAHLPAGEDEEYCYFTHYRDIDGWWQTIEAPLEDRTDTILGLFECLEGTVAERKDKTVPPKGREQSLLLDEIQTAMWDGLDNGTFTNEQWEYCMVAIGVQDEPNPR